MWKKILKSFDIFIHDQKSHDFKILSFNIKKIDKKMRKSYTRTEVGHSKTDCTSEHVIMFNSKYFSEK